MQRLWNPDPSYRLPLRLPELCLGLVLCLTSALCLARPSTVHAELPSEDFVFDYAEALEKSYLFYEAQRSGANLGRVPWREPAALNDGRDVGVDLSGGWFDAGDHVKFGLPMAYSATMLAWGLLESPEGYRRAGQTQVARDNLRFVLDYFLNAYRPGDAQRVDDDIFYYQVGDGNLDHAFWGPPEAMTMPRPTFACTASEPCSEVLGETAAALAAGSLVFADVDSAYAAKLLDHAVKLYAFADLRGNRGYRAANGFYTSFSGFWDELAWGATWLHLATGDGAYLERARQALDRANDGTYFAHSWDNVSNGTSLLLARITGERRYIDRIERHLEHWLTGLPSTPGGLVFLDQYGSLRYATTTAFLALVHASELPDSARAERYRRFALSQINYVLGSNPRNSSYVCGFGNNPPRNPHHRGAHDSPSFSIDSPAINSHVLTGALVGGPKSADDFAWSDDRRDFVANEVATDYNAGYTGALALILALDPRSGDPDPGTDPQPPVDPDPDPDPDPEPTPSPDPGPSPDPTPSPDPGPDPAPVPDPQPEPEPTPDPGSGASAGVDVRVTIQADWGVGYCAEVHVTTESENPVDWRVSFPYAGQITQLWNAVYQAEAGTAIAEGLSWNDTVRKGSPVIFGFCGNR